MENILVWGGLLTIIFLCARFSLYVLSGACFVLSVGLVMLGDSVINLIGAGVFAGCGILALTGAAVIGEVRGASERIVAAVKKPAEAEQDAMAALKAMRLQEAAQRRHARTGEVEAVGNVDFAE